MSRRARAVATGALVVGVYAISASISGHLSPIARRPLLDGISGPIAYRFVHPPPELADTNQAPSSGSFTLALEPDGSQGRVFSTDDAQVTLIVPKGAIPMPPGERSVQVRIEPLDPATLAAPQPPLTVTGNVVRIRATYRPSGREVTQALERPIEVVLLYPFLPNVHGGHTLILSRDGASWTEVDTTDLVSVVQADGRIERFGDVAVAATGIPSPTPTIPGGRAREPFPVAIVIAVLAGAVLLGGLVLGIRNGRRRSAGR